MSALERAQALAPDDAGLAYELAGLLVLRSERTDERTALGDRVRAADLLTWSPTLGRARAGRELPRERALRTCRTTRRRWPSSSGCSKERRGETRLAARWVAYLAAAADGRNAHKRRVKLARAYAREGQIDDAIYCLTPAADAGHAGARDLLRELRGEGARARSEHAPASRVAQGARARGALRPRPLPAPAPAQPAAADRRPLVARHDRSRRGADRRSASTDLIDSLRAVTGGAAGRADADETAPGTEFDDLEELERHRRGRERLRPSRASPPSPSTRPTRSPRHAAAAYQSRARDLLDRHAGRRATRPFRAPAVGRAKRCPPCTRREPAPDRLPDHELARCAGRPPQLAREQRRTRPHGQYESVWRAIRSTARRSRSSTRYYRRRQQHRAARRVARAQRRAARRCRCACASLACARPRAPTRRGSRTTTPRSAASRCSPSSTPRATTRSARSSGCSSAPSAGTSSRGVFEAELARAHAGRGQAAAAAAARAPAPRAARGPRGGRRCARAHADAQARRPGAARCAGRGSARARALRRRRCRCSNARSTRRRRARRSSRCCIRSRRCAAASCATPDRAFAVYERMLALSPGDDADARRAWRSSTRRSATTPRMLQTLERKAALARRARAGRRCYARMARGRRAAPAGPRARGRAAVARGRRCAREPRLPRGAVRAVRALASATTIWSSCCASAC